MYWKTSKRKLSLERPLVMAILNVTPDSFSDGGRFADIDDALRRVEVMIAEGADLIDVGGESTRPGGRRILAAEEAARVVPVIEAITKRFAIPVSIDTSRSEVAAAAVNAGAEIINDVSGLRWDAETARVAAGSGSGLILMHSRGTFETMHTAEPVGDIFADVAKGFRESIAAAEATGVSADRIVLDIGIGFGKTFEQNRSLIANLDAVISDLPQYPMLVGASRKSFIGKILNGASADDRLAGSIAAAAIAVWNGASLIRVHDVKETADAVRVVSALKQNRTSR